jgi:replicative DNA helicase
MRDDTEAKIDAHVDDIAGILKGIERTEDREWLYQHYLARVGEAIVADESGSRGPRSIVDLADECWKEIAETHGRERLGLASGFDRLDECLNGWRGLTLLGAEPNIGKTTLMTAIGRGIVERDLDAIFVMFSFEMPAKEIFWRTVSSDSRLPYHVLRQGSTDGGKRCKVNQRLGHAWNSDDASAADKARERFRIDKKFRRIFVLGPESVGSMSLRSPPGRVAAYPLWPMEMVVRECMRRAEATKAFVGIDYLQRIPVDQGAARSDLDRDERVMEAVHTFQRRLGQPVLAIAEFRKDDTQRAQASGTTSGMAAFAGSRRLAYSADALLTMTSPEKDTEVPEVERRGMVVLQREVTVKVIKVRDGGKRGESKMLFELESSTFKEAKK